MKLRIFRSDLLKALQTVSRALPTVTAIMELTYLKLSVKGDRLQIAATDLRTYIATEIEAIVERPGEILVSGQFFQEVVQALQGYEEKRVILEVQPNRRVSLTLEGETPRYDLSGRDADEYPAIELITPLSEFTVSGKVLKSALRFGIHASAKSENTVQGFCGARITLEASRLVVAAQDGWRLSESSRPASFMVTSPVQWLLPLSVINDWMKLLPDTDLTISSGDNKVLLKVSDTVYQTVLAEGNFMDYEGFFPEDMEDRYAELNRNQFMGHIKGIMPVAKDIGNRIALKLEASRLGMESFSDKLGEAWREMPVTENLLEDFTVALNAQYITDCVGSMGSAGVRFFCEGEEMPVYFWPSEPESEGYLDRAVIMSLTLRSA